MPFPPVCFDCDKTIPFDRYQIGVCPECEKERAIESAKTIGGLGLVAPLSEVLPERSKRLMGISSNHYPQRLEADSMNDPNWHRSTENHDELPGDTFCHCGHMLRDHDVTDLAPCEECDCEAFDLEPSAESLRSANRGD